MKKAMQLALALGLIMLFSGVALADFGQCSDATHAKRTMTKHDENAKTVAAKDTAKAEGDKLALVQKEEPKQSSDSKK